MRAAALTATASRAALPVPAGFPQLYFYMLTQRRKVLRGGSGRPSGGAKLKAK